MTALPLLVLLLGGSAVAAENPLDLSSLLSAGLSSSLPCSRTCLTDVVHAARELLHFNETIENFESLCSTYHNASLCVAEAEVACGNDAPSFASNVDPIKIMCSRKSDSFAPLVPCVEQNIDSILNTCDSSCLFTSSLSELSRRPSVQRMAESGGVENRFRMVMELSSLCDSSSCFISCLSKSLNKACAPAGDDVVAAILRPFYVYSEMLDADETMKAIVFQLAPTTCYPFLVDEGLDKMLEGEYARGVQKEESDLPKPIDTDYLNANEEEDSDKSLSTLLSASGLPSCTDACLGDLLFAAARIFDFNNTIEHFEELCATYSNASLCVASQEMACVHEASFSVGVSGLKELCETKKEDFARHADCLAPIIDSTLNKCDSACQFTQSIEDLVQNTGNVDTESEDSSALYQALAPICPSTGCMISCISRSMDRECAPAGEEIAEALIRPFLKASEMLIELGPEAYEDVKALLPSVCHPFISLTDLADMMEGKESKRWSSSSESSAYDDAVSMSKQMEETMLFKEIQDEMAMTEDIRRMQHEQPMQQPEVMHAQQDEEDLQQLQHGDREDVQHMQHGEDDDDEDLQQLQQGHDQDSQQLQQPNQDLLQVPDDEEDLQQLQHGHEDVQQVQQPDYTKEDHDYEEHQINWGRPGQIVRANRPEFVNV